MAKPDPLGGEPFSYLSRSDGSIVIRYHAAPVTILRGKAALRFTSRVGRRRWRRGTAAHGARDGQLQARQ